MGANLGLAGTVGDTAQGLTRALAAASSCTSMAWHAAPATPSETVLAVDGARPGHLNAAAQADALAVVPPGSAQGAAVDLLVLPQVAGSCAAHRRGDAHLHLRIGQDEAHVR